MRSCSRAAAGPTTTAWRSMRCAICSRRDAEALARSPAASPQRISEGAKAPDEEFKDFKNHVLHVREKDWGGAIEACKEWYRRTVRALAAKDWKQAAWCAGVLSHYYVDPHPAVPHAPDRRRERHPPRGRVELLQVVHDVPAHPRERSRRLSRRATCRAARIGSQKWCSAGAKAANAHYETVIEHYDLRQRA